MKNHHELLADQLYHMRSLYPFDKINVSGKPWQWRQRYINRGYTKVMLQNLSDGELIKRYLYKNSEQAFRVLVDRHYKRARQRFLNHCRHSSDADDLTQQLWMRVIDNLENYSDDDRFPSFLNRISTNLLTDYWRRKGVKDRVFDEPAQEDETSFIDQAKALNSNTEINHEIREQIDYLTTKLIPALPCEQRLVFLLRHESEYWEEKQRLEWSHIAELNGIDKQTAWSRFEQTRNALISYLHNDKTPSPDPDGESQLIFLVWTQSQRLSKQQEFTWDYFAELLNISTNTLKTRYRAALKKLGEGLSDRR